MDNIQLKFPELSSINERMMKEVCEEAKMYQWNAMQILLDLQKSYRLCWTMQMTRRCAQMLLKYESVAIIQLYETGMLEENEYAHILELIENKLYSLEYGRIQMPGKKKKKLEDSFDLIPYFYLLSPSEKNRWKAHMINKHKWIQPGTILLEKHQRVSTAYLIVRGIVQRKDELMPTFYDCGRIVGIDALFAEKSLSLETYMADNGLVETYSIDSVLLALLLSDEKISRSIYNEIAHHLLKNRYRESINLTNSQLRILLNEKVSFHKNPSALTLELETNQRLFLLSGNMIGYSNEEESVIDSIYFILNDYPTRYKLNPSSIVYTWTYEDEIDCLNIKKLETNFSHDNNRHDSIEPFYPLYLGDSSEFFSLRHRSSLSRPIESISNLQLIPLEIEANNQESLPSEFSA